MHMIQVIRSKRLFVINEYLAGQLNPGIAYQFNEYEFSHQMRHAILPHTVKLQTIHVTNDSDVCRASRVPSVRPCDIIIDTPGDLHTHKTTQRRNLRSAN